LTKTEGKKMDISPTTSVQPNHIPAKRFGVRRTSSDKLAMEMTMETNIKAKPFPISSAII
jgi:hypothetical protein